jgi:phage baseplate assembly protein W
MGKIILEFDSVEEQDDARMALDGVKWKVAMWELDQQLRSVTKYGTFDGREATEAEQHMAETLRESIRDILRESNLNLED